MKNKNLKNTPLNGVYEIKMDPFNDERGTFLNIYRKSDPLFKYVWGQRPISQVNISKTNKKGTIRGLHLQSSPYSECKLVRCIKGLVFDVILDLRKNSLTYGDWYSLELCSNKNNAIIIPEGCAHGFQVLEDYSELLYLHSENWEPNNEIGMRWDDPEININWPLKVEEISKRDKSLPLFKNL